jgi:homoserine kinase
LLAADHLYELAQEPEDILREGGRDRGHPDNVAAALYGGFVLCAEDGTLVRHRLEPPEGVEAVVVIPDEQVPTEEARSRATRRGPLGDAVANVASASELVLGIQRSDLGSDRARARRSAAPAVMRPALSALDGDRQGGAPDGCDRGDDLGAGPTVLV